MMQKIIIDTDPGHDDAVAILLAAKHLNILGITTVHGNQTIEKTTRNALKVLEFSGLTHLPVVRGAAKPLIQEAHYSGHIHGETGLDGPALPEPSTPLYPGNAVDFIINTVLTNADVTLVPIGPLTNIALALQKEPTIKQRIREICLMGGSTTFGNVTAAAEFNIWADPEAAHIVFTSGIPLKMVGLNLTREAAATPAVIERLRNLGNNTGRILSEMLTFFSERLRLLFGLEGGSLHDACAVAWLIDPTLITSRKMHVAIELHGQYTRGMTVCDQRNMQPANSSDIGKTQAPNVEVGLKIDVPRLMDLLVETMRQYP